MATQVTTGLLANDAVTDAKLSATITATTQSASDNSTKVATTAYVTTALANLVDSAPGTLNTLNELAAALGDDANFSTTVTNSIATKLPLAGGTLTGDLRVGTADAANRTITIAGGATGNDEGGEIRLEMAADHDSTYNFWRLDVNQDDFRIGREGLTDVLINSSGNFGIGTPPDELLHVKGTNGAIAIDGNGSSNTASIKFINDNERSRITSAYGSGGGGVLTFHTDSTGGSLLERMRIDASGNVGIGVASPGYRLHVNSKLVVGDAPGVGLSGNTIHVRENSNSGIHFPLVIGGGTHVAGAAFGIGLDPEGYGNRNKIAILAEGNGAGYSRGKLHFALDANNNSDQVALADSKMCITENGNIGIGETNPARALDIVSSADYQLQLSNGASAAHYELGRNNTTGAFHFYGNQSGDIAYVFGGADGERLRIDGSGNIGFNTAGIAVGATSDAQVSTATPNRIVFNNDYSNGYTDASLKLYLFNSNTTRQGFTSGPAYDLQYHSSGSASGRHAFYVANTEVGRFAANGLHVGVASSNSYVYLGSQGGAFGGNSSNWMRASGSTLMFNSALSTSSGSNAYVWEASGSTRMALEGNGKLKLPQSPAAGGGETATLKFNTSNGAVAYDSSTREHKDDIEPITIDTAKVYNLEAKSFTWNDKTLSPGEKGFGYIAEEVETVLPELVNTKDGVAHGVNYQMIAVLLLEEVKKLKTRIETLEG